MPLGPHRTGSAVPKKILIPVFLIFGAVASFIYCGVPMNGGSDSAWYYMNAHYLLTGQYIWETGYPSFTGPNQFFFPHGGYSLFIYVTKLLEGRLGVSWVVMLRVIQLGAYLASAALVYAIGSRFKYAWAGLAGMVCFFLYAPFLGYATALLSETITTFLVLLVIWLFLKGLLENRKVLLCLCFFLAGYAVLLKPVLWPVVGLLAVTMIGCQWSSRRVGLWVAVLALAAVCPLAQSIESKLVFGNYRVRGGGGLNLWSRVIAQDQCFPADCDEGQRIGDARIYDFPVKRGMWWLAATYFSKVRGYSKEQTEEVITKIAWQGLMENKSRYAAGTVSQAWHLLTADARVVYTDLDPARPYGFNGPDQAEPQQLPLVQELSRQNDWSGQGVLAGVPANLYSRWANRFARAQSGDLQTFIAVGYLALLLAVAVGLHRRRDSERLAMLATLLTPGMIVVGSCLAESPDPRFRLPAQPLLILACCVGACILAAKAFALKWGITPAGAGRRQTAYACLAVTTLALIVFVCVNVLFIDSSPSRIEDERVCNIDGIEKLAKRDIPGALVCFNRAIEINPRFADAYKNRAGCYAARRQYDLGIADCSRAIEIEPNSASAYSDRGFVYLNKGDSNQAVKDCTQAIELAPGYAEAYLNRGSARLAMGETGLAMQDYARAIELKPDYAEAYSDCGNVYLVQDDWDLAIKEYTKAIELKPDLADAHGNRGSAFVGKGDYRAGIRDFSKALDLHPDVASVYSNRAAAYRRTGEYDKAWADVKACRKLGGTPNPKMLELLVKDSGRSE